MTTGRMHSAGPLNPSQVPTGEALPHSPGAKQQAEAGTCGGWGEVEWGQGPTRVSSSQEP